MARWLPGQSGNYGGRPVGRISSSKRPMNNAFLNAIMDEYDREGPATIARLREANPLAFLQLASEAALIEAQMAAAEVPVRSSVSDYTLAELQQIIRESE